MAKVKSTELIGEKPEGREVEQSHTVPLKVDGNEK
jgi:hypothetical protein